MSEWRHCDGPGCDKKAQLFDDPVDYSDLAGPRINKENPIAEHYSTVECIRGGVFHFHNDACLRKWANKETTVVRDSDEE